MAPRLFRSMSTARKGPTVRTAESGKQLRVAALALSDARMASIASSIEAPPVVVSTISKRGSEERARASSSASCARACRPRPSTPRPPTLSDVPAAAICATLPRNDRRPGDFNGLVGLLTADSSVKDALERRGDHEAGKDRPVARRGGAALTRFIGHRRMKLRQGADLVGRRSPTEDAVVEAPCRRLELPGCRRVDVYRRQEHRLRSCEVTLDALCAGGQGDAILGDGRRHAKRWQRLPHAQRVGFDTSENDAVYLVDAIVTS